MQAVILAAGSGTRLERVSEGRPKCLLPVGGRPIIEHQLEALSDAGIGKVLVVVGHKADEVRSLLGNRVEYIENTLYDTTNSLYSLWLAREWVKGPFVLMNCDVLFHPDILGRLLAKGGNALCFDSTSTKGREQTKVVVHEGRVVDLGKDVSPELARGESLGLACFDDRGAHALFSRANAMVQNGILKCWALEAIRSACSDIDLRAVNVAGLPWVEVDFPTDLERAQKEVWPAMLKGRWKRAVRWRRTKYAAMAGMTAVFLLAGFLIGLNAGTEKFVWENATPEGSEEVLIKLPKGNQKWWLSRKGAPLRVTLSGPTSARADVRLLMPPGTAQPGKFVLQVSVDGEPLIWSSLKATPDEKASAPGSVVGDRDRVKFDVPEGDHTIEVDLLAGTSEMFLARISYPEPVIPDEEAGDEE